MSNKKKDAVPTCARCGKPFTDEEYVVGVSLPYLGGAYVTLHKRCAQNVAAEILTFVRALA